MSEMIKTGDLMDSKSLQQVREDCTITTRNLIPSKREVEKKDINRLVKRVKLNKQKLEAETKKKARNA